MRIDDPTDSLSTHSAFLPRNCNFWIFLENAWETFLEPWSLFFHCQWQSNIYLNIQEEWTLFPKVFRSLLKLRVLKLHNNHSYLCQGPPYRRAAIKWCHSFRYLTNVLCFSRNYYVPGIVLCARGLERGKALINALRKLGFLACN